MKPVYEQQRGNSGSSAKRQTAEITESKQGVCQDYKTSLWAVTGQMSTMGSFKVLLCALTLTLLALTVDSSSGKKFCRFNVVVRFKSSCVAGCTEHRLHQTNSVSFWQEDTATTTTTCRVSSSQISTTLQCTKLNGWSDRLDPVGPRLDRSATPASGQATRSPYLFKNLLLSLLLMSIWNPPSPQKKTLPEIPSVFFSSTLQQLLLTAAVMGHHTWAQTGFYVSRLETFLTFATKQRQTTAWPKLWHHISLLFFEKAQIASNCRISYSAQAPLHFLHPQIRSFASLSSQMRFDSSNLGLSDVWWAQRQTRYVFSSLRVTLADGSQWLIHKGQDYGISSDTVVTSARHMSSAWKVSQSLNWSFESETFLKEWWVAEHKDISSVE